MSRLFLFKYPIKKSAFIIVNLFLLTLTFTHTDSHRQLLPFVYQQIKIYF